MPWQPRYTVPVVISAIVVLALVGVALSQFGAPPTGEAGDGGTTPTSTATTTPPIARPKPRSKNVSKVQPKLTYDGALEQFRDRRFQFDGCLVTPTYQTYKSGSVVMLDNRSPDGVEVRLDGVVHRLYGYEFKLVTLTAKTLPHTVKVDCTTNDTPAYNVAQILLQQ